MNMDGTVLVRPRNGRESGVAIIVVMMFALVFLALGAALFVLVRTSQSSTELERKEVKAFNVAEAGVDAGMLALKLHWPSSEAAAVTQATLDDLGAQVRTQLQATNPGLWDPKRSDPSQFIDIRVYDNWGGADGLTPTVPDPENAPFYDSNGDDRMFVDSRANVDDDRHRIIVLAEFIALPLPIPSYAMVATKAGANNSNQLRVGIDPSYTNPLAANSVPVIFQEETDFGVDLQSSAIYNIPQESFDMVVDAKLLSFLADIATVNHTFFTSTTSAEDYLQTSESDGSVVYVQSTSNVTITLKPFFSDDGKLGSPTRPIVLVLDTPMVGDSFNLIESVGNIEFYGVIISLNGTKMKGDSTVYGAVLSKGALDSSGGAQPEIRFNPDIIDTLNGQFPVSVNMVPNTWEEYTIAPGAAY